MRFTSYVLLQIITQLCIDILLIVILVHALAELQRSQWGQLSPYPLPLHIYLYVYITLSVN